MLSRSLFRGNTLARNNLHSVKNVSSSNFRGFATEIEDIQVEKSDGVAIMKMSKKPVNSLSTSFLTQFHAAFDEIEKDKSCKGLILTSSVPKVFSAGLDILEFYQKPQDQMERFWKTLQDVWIRLYGTQLPTVAAINGEAPAGGCMLALSCDYRVIGSKYRIGLNETQLGIVAPSWFRDVMKNTIGHRHTERLLELGAMVPGPEALSIGLVDAVEETDEQVLERAQAELSKYMKIPARARGLTKQAMRGPTLERLVSAREADTQNFLGFVSTEPVQKMIGLYLEQLKSRSKK